MLIVNKAVSLIIVVFMAYMLQSMTFQMEIKLNEPKMTEDYVYDDNFEIIDVNIVENPNAIQDENIRKLCESMLFLIPYGHDTFYGKITLPENIGWMPVCAFAFSTITTGIGVVCFNRKDLK